MSIQSNAGQKVKEGIFYLLGVLLVAGFVILYFPRFFGMEMIPPAIRFLFSLGADWAIGVNAGIFILFLLRIRILLSKNTDVLSHSMENLLYWKTPNTELIERHLKT